MLSLDGFSGFSTVKSHPNSRCYRQTLPVPSPAPKQPGRAWSAFAPRHAIKGLVITQNVRAKVWVALLVHAHIFDLMATGFARILLCV